MPGFTHMQAAQPVTFGHHCMAYVEMFSRDLSRVRDAIERMDESPLGAAALAGTSFPIDRHQTAKALGFREPMRNSLDSVSDRDFALEFLALAAICATHLSRLAEEIIIWSTPQFGFIRLSDSFSTGSSIMPQKKNPDAAELVRGKTGRVTGHLVGLLTVMKGMPLTYGKDMQEDKESVFDAAETLDLMLAAMTGMVRDMTVNAAAMKKPLAQATRPRPTLPTGWCARWACPSARRTMSQAARWRWLKRRRSAWRSFRWRICNRSTPASPRTSSRYLRCRIRSRAAQASAAPRRRKSGSRSVPGKSASPRHDAGVQCAENSVKSGST